MSNRRLESVQEEWAAIATPQTMMDASIDFVSLYVCGNDDYFIAPVKSKKRKSTRIMRPRCQATQLLICYHSNRL